MWRNNENINDRTDIAMVDVTTQRDGNETTNRESVSMDLTKAKINKQGSIPL